MAVKSSPPAPSPDGEGVSDPLALGAAPKGRDVNNPVRSAGYKTPCIFRAEEHRHIAEHPCAARRAGRVVVPPRAAFRIATLARGYSCCAPSGLGELGIKNWLWPKLEINKK
jgi:hypothetical protein